MADITKNALAMSLKNLLSHTTLDKITIQDIVDECNVKRQTFYYHFKDIYDLIEWIYKIETSKAINIHKTKEDWQQGFYDLFVYILKNKSFIINTYRSISREILEKYLYEGTYILLNRVILEQAKELCVAGENICFITNFYKYSFVGILLNWIESGMKEDPSIIVEKINILIRGSFKDALSRFDKIG